MVTKLHASGGCNLGVDASEHIFDLGKAGFLMSRNALRREQMVGGDSSQTPPIVAVRREPNGAPEQQLLCRLLKRAIRKCRALQNLSRGVHLARNHHPRLPEAQRHQLRRVPPHRELREPPVRQPTHFHQTPN